MDDSMEKLKKSFESFGWDTEDIDSGKTPLESKLSQMVLTKTWNVSNLGLTKVESFWRDLNLAQTSWNPKEPHPKEKVKEDKKKGMKEYLPRRRELTVMEYLEVARIYSQQSRVSISEKSSTEPQLDQLSPKK